MRIGKGMCGLLALMCVVVVACSGALAAEAKKAPAKAPNAMQLLEAAAQQCAKLNQFTQYFSKQERIGGQLHEKETIFLKFRAKPLSIYAKWVENPYKDRELIYVEGKEGGKYVLHEYVGPVNVLVKEKPSSKEALKRSCRPVAEFGVRNLMQVLMRQVKAAAKKKELRISYIGEERIKNKPVDIVMCLFPKKREYEAYMVVAYIEKQRKYPIRLAGYDWDNNLLWVYESWRIVPQAKLSKKDFDLKNKEYDFPLLPFGLPRPLWPFK